MDGAKTSMQDFSTYLYSHKISPAPTDKSILVEYKSF